MGDIHRKKTYEQLAEKLVVADPSAYFNRTDMELAIRVIESQEKLIQSLVEKKKNLQKLCKRLEELRILEDKQRKSLQVSVDFWKTMKYKTVVELFVKETNEMEETLKRNHEKN